MTTSLHEPYRRVSVAIKPLTCIDCQPHLLIQTQDDYMRHILEFPAHRLVPRESA